MRQESDYCEMCGNPIEVDMIGRTNICGTCADDFISKQDALISQVQAETEAGQLGRQGEKYS